MSYDPESPEVCPENCTAAITAFSDEVGCCYQNFYNDTTALYAFVATEFLTADQAYILGNATYPSLWSACGVDLVQYCDGEPFPGTSTLIAGVCQLEDFGEVVTDGSECANSLGTILNPFPDQFEIDDYEEAFDVFCNEECAGKISMFERDECFSPFNAELTVALCYSAEDKSAPGSRCGFTVGEHVAPIFEAVGAACYFDYTNPDVPCPSNCTTQLQTVRSQFGCCFQEIYNNTNIVDLFILEGLIDFDERLFFAALGDYNLWNKCEVPLLGRCPEDPLNAGAIKFAASSVIILIATLFIPLL